MLKAYDINSGRVIAVKKIDIIGAYGNDRATLQELEVFMRKNEKLIILIKFLINKAEMGIIKSLHHKNIVEFYGFEKLENCLFLYLEFMSLGD